MVERHDSHPFTDDQWFACLLACSISIVTITQPFMIGGYSPAIHDWTHSDCFGLQMVHCIATRRHLCGNCIRSHLPLPSPLLYYINSSANSNVRCSLVESIQSFRSYSYTSILGILGKLVIYNLNQSKYT